MPIKIRNGGYAWNLIPNTEIARAKRNAESPVIKSVMAILRANLRECLNISPFSFFACDKSFLTPSRYAR